ncbi:MAG: complex I subunit 5 family protein [Candidatus Izemoplasmatales bacterium]
MFFLFVSYLNNWFNLNIIIESSIYYDQYVQFLNNQSIDIFLIIFVPIFGAAIELIYREKKPYNRDKSLIYMGFFVILLLIAIYPKVVGNQVDYVYPRILQLGISFRIDMLAYTVLMVSAFVWFYVIIYAHEYMKHELHSTRFFFFFALTYSSILGAIMAGDLFTMFLFFELMTLASYTLVIHGQDEKSYRAGYNYILMGLIGGFLIFVAILLIYFNIGDLSFHSAINILDRLGGLKYWIIGLLIVGFGIKAGMAPVHVWLPRAHPVAPSPASAILSGIMIKVGAFGMIRVATSYYFPGLNGVVDGDNPVWFTASTVGAIIIWTGIFTMLLGVFLALQESNIKKLLAYSSISQMGYILTGIGVALYLGYVGSMGYTGAVYHIINHAVFKSLLFMVAGVIHYHTNELNMYKLGGILKKLPFTSFAFVVGMFGVIGMPLFNGYISKTILHHGLVEAYEYGSQIFILAEILFIIASIGTVAYFVKMFYYVFIKENQNEYKDLKFGFTSFDLALGAMSIFIIWIGLRPQFVLNHLIIPQLNSMAYSKYFVESYIKNMNLFLTYDLLMALGIIAMGIGLFYVGKKYKWFTIKLPSWLSIEQLFFYPAYLLMQNLCRILYGDRCPYDDKEFSKLREKDTEKVTFIDRFIITANVLNRRYETAIIHADAFIYLIIISGIFLFFLISNFSLYAF